MNKMIPYLGTESFFWNSDYCNLKHFPEHEGNNVVLSLFIVFPGLRIETIFTWYLNYIQRDRYAVKCIMLNPTCSSNLKYFVINYIVQVVRNRHEYRGLTWFTDKLYIVIIFLISKSLMDNWSDENGHPFLIKH